MKHKHKAPKAWVKGPFKGKPQTPMDRDIVRFQLLVEDAKSCRRDDATSFMRYYREIHSLWIKHVYFSNLGLTRIEEMNELRNIAKRHRAEAIADFWAEVDELEEHLFSRCSHDHRLRGRRDHHLIRLCIDRLWVKRAQFRKIFGSSMCKKYMLTVIMDEYRHQLDNEQRLEDESKGRRSTPSEPKQMEPCAA